MGEIEINGKWKLVEDSTCVRIYQKTSEGGEVIKSGKYEGQLTAPRWEITYHATIKSAFKHMVEKRVQKAMWLGEVAGEIERIQQDIDKLDLPKRL